MNTPDFQHGAQVRIELDPALSQLTPSLPASLETCLRTLFLAFCNSMGLPACDCQVITAPSALDASTPNPFRMFVENRLVRVPAENLREACSYESRQLLPKDWKFSDWSRSNPKGCAPAIAAACAEAVKRKPSVLYCPSAGSRYGIDALTLLLDCGFSIRDRVALQARFKDLDEASPDLPEKLLADWNEPGITVRINNHTLRSLTSGQPQPTLQHMRSTIQQEWAIDVPRIRFEPDDTIANDSFILALNDLQLAPVMGIPTDAVWINDSTARVLLPNVKTTAAVNPETYTPITVLNSTDSSAAAESGFTTWNAWTWFHMQLGQMIRRCAGLFVTLKSVQAAIGVWEHVAPRAMAAMNSHVTLADLTAVLRAVASAGVPTSHLGRIAECLIDRSYTEIPASSSLVLDTTPGSGEAQGVDSLEQFLRAGLRREISAKLCRDATTAILYLLDPSIEELLAKAEPVSDEDGNQICAAIHRELSFLPPLALMPAILTGQSTRAAAWKLIQSEFPRLTVVAHEELSPEINVQPVARIALSR